MAGSTEEEKRWVVALMLRPVGDAVDAGPARCENARSGGM